MPENGHLNGPKKGVKGAFWTLKMGFPGFPGFGLCRGRGGLQASRQEAPERSEVNSSCERTIANGILYRLTRIWI